MYVQISSSQKPSPINHSIFPYLREKHIYLQRNDLQSSNLIVTAWLHCVHPDYTSGFDIKQRMTQQLGGFDEFQLKVCTNFCPSLNVSACARFWVIEMEKRVLKEKFGHLFVYLLFENDI